MSASQKKKLRNEQNAVQMTEKQIAEQKEAKKLHMYTVIFSVAIVLMLCVVLFTTVAESGVIQRHTTAATVGDHEISAPELNYYYIDAINNFQREWGEAFLFSGITLDTPLDEQVYNEESGETWADFFLDQATNTMLHTYALYNAAVADNYSIDTEASAEIENMLRSTELQAMMNTGVKDLKAYLKTVYGTGANEESFRHYVEVQYLASQYAMDHMESLTYTPEQLRAKDSEDPTLFNAYTWNHHYLSATSFLAGGTKDDEGIVTYSDEERAAAAAEAKKVAESVLAQDIHTVADLDSALAGLEIYAGDPPKSVENKDRPKSQIPESMAEWITDADRRAGDVTLIPNETTTTDADGNTTTTVSGYYVVLFGGVNDNNIKLSNVRHILVKFEGGTKDDATQTILYSDDEKDKARAEAEGILAQFKAGDATEEAFAALATEKTDDTGSAANGGLIEHILPTSNLVPSFRDWAVDASRKAGDTDIIESQYGYHVMYYVGDSELNYRDTMVQNSLINEDMAAWEDALVKPVSAEVTNKKYVALDLVIPSSNQVQ